MGGPSIIHLVPIALCDLLAMALLRNTHTADQSLLLGLQQTKADETDRSLHRGLVRLNIGALEVGHLFWEQSVLLVHTQPVETTWPTVRDRAAVLRGEITTPFGPKTSRLVSQPFLQAIKFYK